MNFVSWLYLLLYIYFSLRNWDTLSCFLNFFHDDMYRDDIDIFAAMLGQVFLYAAENNVRQSYNCINSAQLSVRLFPAFHDVILSFAF